MNSSIWLNYTSVKKNINRLFCLKMSKAFVLCFVCTRRMVRLPYLICNWRRKKLRIIGELVSPFPIPGEFSLILCLVFLFLASTSSSIPPPLSHISFFPFFSCTFVCNLEDRSTMFHSSAPLLHYHLASTTSVNTTRLCTSSPCAPLPSIFFFFLYTLQTFGFPFTINLHNWDLIFAFRELQIWLPFLFWCLLSSSRQAPPSPNIEVELLFSCSDPCTLSVHFLPWCLSSINRYNKYMCR